MKIKVKCNHKHHITHALSIQKLLEQHLRIKINQRQRGLRSKFSNIKQAMPYPHRSKQSTHEHAKTQEKTNKGQCVNLQNEATNSRTMNHAKDIKLNVLCQRKINLVSNIMKEHYKHLLLIQNSKH